jgi:hypothetical protein
MNTSDRGSLAVRFRVDETGAGEVEVQVSSNGFAGRGVGYVDTAYLTAFASELMSYPLPDGERTFITGFGSVAQRDAGLLDQEHVGLRVYRVGEKGQVGIRVHLSEKRWPDDRPEAAADVWLELLTTYERLGAFGSALAAAAQGETSGATIEEDLLE